MEVILIILSMSIFYIVNIIIHDGIIFSNKKYINLIMFIRAVWFMFLIMGLMVLAFMFMMFSSFYEGMIIFIISIFSFFGARETIFGGFRILNYWINRKKILEKGSIELGKIIEVNSVLATRRKRRKNVLLANYLVVYCNGKTISSLFYYDKVYNIYDEVEVITYNNKKYIIP